MYKSWPPRHEDYINKIPDSEKFSKIVGLFEQHDEDGNKTLSFNEISHIFRSLGYPKTKSQLRALISEYDGNRNNAIEFREFINMAQNNLFYRWPPVYSDYKEEISSETRFNEIFAAFKMFDVNNDKSISVKELRKALQKMGHVHDDRTVRMMHEFVDIDGDGQIQFNEFVKLVEIEDSPEMNTPQAILTRQQEAFKMMSSNGSVITRRDLKSFSKKVFPAELDTKEIEAIMDMVAEGKDHITFDDAQKHMFKIMQI